MDVGLNSTNYTSQCNRSFIKTVDKNFTNVTLSDNFTECVDEEIVITGLPTMEMISILVTGGLGLTGTVFNIGILVIIFQKKLINTDYRMVYYMFITVGDLLFAVHSIILAFNIAFKSVYFFRVVGFCLTFIIVMGIVAYQWSAICIILLLIDLVWSIRHPFGDNKAMKVFSKIGCVWTFVLAIILGVGPFLYWNDVPYDVTFCSIANLYGVHWDFYQHEAVIVLSVLFALMILVSCILLQQIYRTQITDINKSERTIKNAAVDIEKANDCKGEAGSLHSKEEQKKNGKVNSAYVVDEVDSVSEDKDIEENKKDNEDEKQRQNKLAQNKLEGVSRREERSREFIKACRTVGVFMGAYLGCCSPYFIWNIRGLGCGAECSNDSPQARAMRSLVATALYLLPVIDPILYTRRFRVFRNALRAVLRMFVCRKRKQNTIVSLS